MRKGVSPLSLFESNLVCRRTAFSLVCDTAARLCILHSEFLTELLVRIELSFRESCLTYSQKRIVEYNRLQLFQSSPLSPVNCGNSLRLGGDDSQPLSLSALSIAMR
jgi:hypothetical protein